MSNIATAIAEEARRQTYAGVVTSLAGETFFADVKRTDIEDAGTERMEVLAMAVKKDEAHMVKVGARFDIREGGILFRSDG